MTENEEFLRKFEMAGREHFTKWLKSRGLDLPDFGGLYPSKTAYHAGRQDVWAQHPETGEWFWRPADRPSWPWVKTSRDPNNV